MNNLSHQTFTWPQFVSLASLREKLPLQRSASLETHRAHWHGSESLDEALSTARVGWPEGTARIAAGLEQAASLSSYYQVPPVIYDVGGELPDVGAYCAGEPLHMMSWDRDGQSGAQQIVEMAICGTQWHKLTAKQIEFYGLALLSAVDALERAGKDVVLYWYTYITGGSGAKLLYEILLKSAGEQMELDRMAFALAHPSMNRRLRFAVSEIMGQDYEAGGITASQGQIERAVLMQRYGDASNKIPDSAKQPGRYYAPNMYHIVNDLYSLEAAMTAIGKSLDAHLGYDSDAAAA